MIALFLLLVGTCTCVDGRLRDISFGGTGVISREALEIAHKYHAKFKRQIVGGQDAGETDYPYVAVIHRKNANEDDEVCIGAILNKVWILTSAFCTLDGSFATDEFRVIAGVYNISMLGSGPNEQWREVDHWQGSADWAFGSSRGAITLMHLKEELTWTDYVKPAPSVSNTAPVVGSTVTAMGWGAVTPGLPYSINAALWDPNRIQARAANASYWAIATLKPLLQTADFTVISEDAADTILTTFFGGVQHTVGPKHVYFQSAGKGTCSYLDDGAPVISQDGTSMYGIVSWRPGCADTVDVSVDLASYYSWVVAATNPNPVDPDSNLHVTPYNWQLGGTNVQLIVGFTSSTSDLGNRWKLNFADGWNITDSTQTIAFGKNFPSSPNSWWIGDGAVWFEWNTKPTIPTGVHLWFRILTTEASSRCDTTHWKMEFYDCDGTCTQSETVLKAANYKQTGCESPESQSVSTTLPSPWVQGSSPATNTWVSTSSPASFRITVANTLKKIGYTGVTSANVVIESVEDGSVIITWHLININPATMGGDADAMVTTMKLTSTVAVFNAEFVNQHVMVTVGVTAAADNVNGAPIVLYSGVAETTAEDTILTGFVNDVEIEDTVATTTQEFNITLALTQPVGTIDLDGYTPALASDGGLTKQYVLTLADFATALSTAFRFDPNDDWWGRAYVTITVNDLGLPSHLSGGPMWDSVTVPIDVTAVNDAATVILGGGNPWPTNEEVQVAFNFNISDVDANTATDLYTVTVEAGTNGTVSHSGTCNGCTTSTTSSSLTQTGTIDALNAYFWSGDLMFTPAANLNDMIAVSIIVDDNGIHPAPGIVITDYAWFDVKPINDPITITQAATSMSGDEDTWISIPATSLSEPDRDGNVQLNVSMSQGTLQLATATGVTIMDSSSGGTQWYYLWGPRSKINTILSTTQYRGNQDWNGEDLIEMWASDQGNYGENTPNPVFTTYANISVTINKVNDAPVITMANALTVHRASSLSVVVSVVDVDVNDGDGNHLLTVTVVAPNGTLTLTTTTGLDVTTPTSGATTDVDAKLVFSGSITDVNNALATLVYKDDFPHGDFITHIEDDLHNEDTLTVMVNDNGNDDGPATDPQESSASVTITVTTNTYPTCGSFITTNPTYCGCYYKVNHGDTDDQTWITLPTSFPSNQFEFIETAALPYRFVQGCCARKSNAQKGLQLTDVGHMGVCTN